MSRHRPYSGSLPNGNITNHTGIFQDATFPEALCDQRLGVNPELWFQLPGPQHREDTTEAMSICALCPEREKCLTYALDNDITEGIWGGLLPSQRRRIKKDISNGWRLELR